MSDRGSIDGGATRLVVRGRGRASAVDTAAQDTLSRHQQTNAFLVHPQRPRDELGMDQAASSSAQPLRVLVLISRTHNSRDSRRGLEPTLRIGP
jgi:hypothetical protein